MTSNREGLSAGKSRILRITKSSVSFNRSDDKARRVQKKQKDSYLNAFSNKIKQNIDKYRTELSTENDNDTEDVPVASSVSNFQSVIFCLCYLFFLVNIIN